MGENENQYSKILGNIYLGYFLGFLFIVGATMGLTWPENSTHIPLVPAICISLQLLITVYLTWTFIDDDCTWKDNFTKRLFTHLIFGSAIPYILVSGINHTYSVIYALDITNPLYSKQFVATSMVIVLVFNACVTIYFYICMTYDSANKEQDPEYEMSVITITYPKHILGKNGKQEFLLDLNEVSYIQVINKVVLVYYSDNEVYSLMKPLKDVKAILDPDRFMQINRSYIICRKVISSYQKRSDGGLIVILFYNEREVSVSISADMTEASINWFVE